MDIPVKAKSTLFPSDNFCFSMALPNILCIYTQMNLHIGYFVCKYCAWFT